MQILYELEGAIGRGYRDETAHDQKKGHTDTSGHRRGSWLPPETGYFGKDSADLLTGDHDNPHRAEKLILAWKWDEVPGHAHLGRFPMFQFMAQSRLETTQDNTMIPLLTLCSAGIFPHVPIHGVTTGVPAFPAEIALQASNGRYLCSEQHLANVPVTANREAAGPWERWKVVIPVLFCLLVAGCGEKVQEITASTPIPVAVVDTVVAQPPPPVAQPQPEVARSVFSMRETADRAEIMQRCRGNGGTYIPAMAFNGIMFWRVCSIPGKHTVWPAGAHHAEFVTWTYQPWE